MTASFHNASQPIAIIGLGCRFPGAPDPMAFWRLLRAGEEAIREVPGDRWDVDAYYDPTPATPGKMNTRRGGFLDRVDGFDARFFGISPWEAATMDPQQRLLLEVAWEALEDAGQIPTALAGSRTGVFIGIWNSDYARMLLDDPGLINAHSALGNASSIAANRLSYLLDLRGPSMAIDTASSASLVAVHLACQSIRAGESEMAIVGGVNLILSPAITINMSQAGTMASDGRCKTFDANADGYVRSEGVAAIVLKPYHAALVAGDPVLALIRGSASNNDGATSNLMAPNGDAQEAVIRQAIADAGLTPDCISYVEAHGTGTPLGDATEVRALNAVLGQGRPADRPCWLGSVKTNVGHMEAAAGLCGLIKVVLALQNDELPPHLHLQDINPRLELDRTPFRIPRTLTPWPRQQAGRAAGVSSFGFGGANAHVIVGEAPARAITRPGDAPQVLALSARSPESLRQQADRYERFCRETRHPFANIAFTTTARRAHHEHRLALVAATGIEAADLLAAFLADEAPEGVFTGRVDGARRLAFVFSGQGAQYPAMGRRLIERSPRFRQELETIDALYAPLSGHSLIAELMQEGDASRIDETRFTQPTIFALQVALTRLLGSWGIHPDAVVGHSIGEVAAFHIAGCLTLEAAVELVHRRGRLLQEMSGRGRMALLAVGEAAARDLIAGQDDVLAVAAVNSATSTLLAGEERALEAVLARVREQGAFGRMLKVDVPFHSPQLEPVRAALEAELVGLSFRPPVLPLYSTVTAGRQQTAPDAAYWGKNLRAPVRFAETLSAMAADGLDAFLELNAHPVLGEAIAQQLYHDGRPGEVLASLRRERDDLLSLRTALARLHAMGRGPDWQAIHTPSAQCVPLPAYAWDHPRHWIDTRKGGSRIQVPAVPADPEATLPASGKTGMVPGLESLQRPLRRTGDLSREVLDRMPHTMRWRVLEAQLRFYLGMVLGVPSDGLDPERPFQELGLDSLRALELRSRFQVLLDTVLPPTIVWQFPSIRALARHLAGEEGVAEASPHAGNASRDIAIVGMACRFPGAQDLDAYWRLLIEGRDAIAEVPGDRWDRDALFSPDHGRPGKMNTRWGGFLTDVDRFDARFFGISPREAADMDPQQRLLLEVAWEALEHAGQAPERLAGSRTGVFVGLWNQDYARLYGEDRSQLDLYRSTGTSSAIASNRLSYLLDLRGPSVTVDTACSSSLVALDLACQSLREGRSEVALAGGVNLILAPEVTIAFSQSGMMAGDGRCKTFDAAADGYVRSEGCGVVVLKRLEDALAAGDRILGVVRGAAVNQDGHSNGLTAPNGQAQEAVIRDALHDARLSPDAIGYVEAHGTGTPLGDPIEVQALNAVLAVGRPPHSTCWLGSVKTNIGHTESAAGMAGLIKVVLAMQHDVLPPHLHFHEANPHLGLEGTPFRIPTEPVPWPAGERRRLAGISSFGYGGTNAHVIIEEAPSVPDPTRPELPPPYLLPLSARHPGALRDLAEAYRAHLVSDHAVHPADLCHTLALRRSHHPHRAAIRFTTRAELLEALGALAENEPHASVLANGGETASPSGLVFVFPGQGGQWRGMGQELFTGQPVFREAILKAEDAFRPYVNWSLHEQLHADEHSSRLAEIDVVQPMLFAIQVALSALLASWGIRPDAVVGHSMGEIAAAHVAGALALEDAARVICRRSRLLRRISGQGAMAHVELSFSEAETAIATRRDRLAIAVSNSPRGTVLSGDPAALQEVLDELQAHGVFWRHVKVDVASHSPQVDPLRDDLFQALSGLEPRPAAVPLLSTVEGRLVDGTDLDAGYWIRNLREPVRFSDAVRQLSDSGHHLYLEISPHPVLNIAILESAPSRHTARLVTMRRNEPEMAALLAAVGGLYVHGHAVPWDRLYAAGRPIALPGYPWQKERHWLAGNQGLGAGRQRISGGSSGHPLLGERLSLPQLASRLAGFAIWESQLGLAREPWLGDHCVQGMPVLPAAAYVEIALAAGLELFGPSCALEDMTLTRALLLGNEDVSVQLTVEPEHGGRARFHLASRHPGDDAPWQEHASGFLRRYPGATQRAPGPPESLRDRPFRVIAAEDHYRTMTQNGLDYGPRFRGLEFVHRGDGEALGQLVQQEGPYRIHPVTLDSAFQTAIAAMLDPEEQGEPWLPVGIEALRQEGHTAAAARVEVRLRPLTSAGVRVADLTLLDTTGRALARIVGLKLQRLGTMPAEHLGWLHRVVWRQKARQEPESRPALGQWIVFCDEGSTHAAVIDRLEAMGAACVKVRQGARFGGDRTIGFEIDPARPEDHRRLLQEAFPAGAGCAGIVHLSCLDLPPTSLTDRHALGRAQDVVCASVVGLFKALVQLGWRQAPRVFLVTRGVPAVALAPEVLSVAQAPLWGLVRILAHEHPHLQPTMVDIGADDEREVETLVAELLAGDAEDQVALRGIERYVPRLVTCRPELQRPRIRPEATYLITGGLGGLGLTIAAWLVEEGARHLVLNGRKPPGEPILSALERLRAEGAEVRIAPGDVSRPEDVEAILATIPADAPLAGVVHAAGVLDDATLQQLTIEQFARVMRPKAFGAWNLHACIGVRPLDFFVLFSSIVSTLGSPGQGSYGAANAFLDALAAHRQALGLPALSIAWGPWSEVGLAAARSDRGERLAARGLGSIDPRSGVAAFADVLGGTEPVICVAPFNLRQWTQAYPKVAESPLLHELRSSAEGQATRQHDGGLRNRFVTATPAERQDLLVAHLRDQAAEVLRLPAQDLKVTVPLPELGLDSLMAIELRNRLEASLGVTLAATLLWSYPTVQALAGFLGPLLEETAPAAPEAERLVPAAAGAEPPEELVARIAQMSEEETALLLLERLAALEKGL